MDELKIKEWKEIPVSSWEYGEFSKSSRYFSAVFFDPEYGIECWRVHVSSDGCTPPHAHIWDDVNETEFYLEFTDFKYALEWALKKSKELPRELSVKTKKKIATTEKEGK